ncbi:MAG: NAD(+) diphosphatase [Filomicrobium sp.]
MKPTLGPTVTLDRQSEKRPDKEYISQLTEAETSKFFVLAGAKPIVDIADEREGPRIRWFTGAEIDAMGLAVSEAIFLGVDPTNNQAYFTVATSEHYARGAPHAREQLKNRAEIRNLAAQGQMPADELALVSQAAALALWHENNRCCGRCGGSMTFKFGGWKRKCWACGYEAYPRVDPVVIMAVTDGERMVLAHEGRFPDKMYSALAGHVEPGDDVEHAVIRETKEEVGLNVDRVELLGSQPWPFPYSLMLGCIGYAEAKELVVDANEIEHARWFSKDEVQQMLASKHPEELWLPGAQSMAHHVILACLEKLPS